MPMLKQTKEMVGAKVQILGAKMQMLEDEMIEEEYWELLIGKSLQIILKFLLPIPIRIMEEKKPSQDSKSRW